jgi:hypothetical protein
MASSQALATLIQTVSASSIDFLWDAVNRGESARAQSRAFVSSRSFNATCPRRLDDGARQRLVEVAAEPNAAAKIAEAQFSAPRHRTDLGHRHAVLRDDELLAFGRALDQSREMRLRLVEAVMNLGRRALFHRRIPWSNLTNNLG